MNEYNRKLLKLLFPLSVQSVVLSLMKISDAILKTFCDVCLLMSDGKISYAAGKEHLSSVCDDAVVGESEMACVRGD